jgi:hypothetical protein
MVTEIGPKAMKVLKDQVCRGMALLETIDEHWRNNEAHSTAFKSNPKRRVSHLVYSS